MEILEMLDLGSSLVILAQSGQDIVATMQLSFLPGLARRGAWRAQLEAVRVHEAYRNRGLGAAIVAWAISESRAARGVIGGPATPHGLGATQPGLLLRSAVGQADPGRGGFPRADVGG